MDDLNLPLNWTESSRQMMIMKPTYQLNLFYLQHIHLEMYPMSYNEFIAAQHPNARSLTLDLCESPQISTENFTSGFASSFKPNLLDLSLFLKQINDSHLEAISVSWPRRKKILPTHHQTPLKFHRQPSWQFLTRAKIWRHWKSRHLVLEIWPPWFVPILNSVQLMFSLR